MERLAERAEGLLESQTLLEVGAWVAIGAGLER